MSSSSSPGDMAEHTRPGDESSRNEAPAVPGRSAAPLFIGAGLAAVDQEHRHRQRVRGHSIPQQAQRLSGRAGKTTVRLKPRNWAPRPGLCRSQRGPPPRLRPAVSAAIPAAIAPSPQRVLRGARSHPRDFDSGGLDAGGDQDLQADRRMGRSSFAPRRDRRPLALFALASAGLNSFDLLIRRGIELSAAGGRVKGHEKPVEVEA